MRTQVGIVGAGPAGLMLARLLHLQGIESVVIDKRSRDRIEKTIKAGILEHGTVELMQQTGLGDRLKRDGAEHHGIYLWFNGQNHRIDLSGLTSGKTVTVCAQHEVLIDLIARRLKDDGQLLFEVDDVAVEDLTSTSPTIRFTDAEGTDQVLDCDFVAAAAARGPTPGSGSPRERCERTISTSTHSPGSESSPRHHRRPTS